MLFNKVKQRFPWLECVFADTGYNAQQTYEAAAENSLRLEIVRRNPAAIGFEVIKKRWVVERTFSWFGRNRRLAKDFEKPCRNPAGLRHPRCHPVRHQEASAVATF